MCPMVNQLDADVDATFERVVHKCFGVRYYA